MRDSFDTGSTTIIILTINPTRDLLFIVQALSTPTNPPYSKPFFLPPRAEELIPCPLPRAEMRNGAIPVTRRIAAAPCRKLSDPRCPLVPRRWSSTITTTTTTPTTPTTTAGGSTGRGRRRNWSTPLAKTIAEAIETTGPISIAAYMRQCLTSPQGGYYTTARERSDQFGREGDFITSPEISQVFGELVGIWFVTEWMAQGRRSGGVQLIELGPGRGTLMDDVLRTIATFRGFASSVEKVYLVEAGAGLRQAQKTLLCGRDGGEMVRTEHGWGCVSKYAGIPVEWVEDITLLPKDEGKEKTPFIIAHEFFDALPIHAFESVAPSPAQQDRESSSILDRAGNQNPLRQSATPAAPQWRELVVTPTPERRLHPSPLPIQKETETSPDFQLTHSKSSTPTSLLLPESSSRYRALRSRVGSCIEISPDSSRHMGDLARRIGGSANISLASSSSSSSSATGPRASGAALIIDYGPKDTVPVNSLRGIKAHGRVSPFAEPGLVDLSADVDFTALAEAACAASPAVEVWGPVEQGDFLTELGGELRVEQLLQGLKTTKRDHHHHQQPQQPQQQQQQEEEKNQKGGGEEKEKRKEA